ncbi:hypothetical protein KKA14_16055, partial [bacterium]|nr:hypothetical protein [bacterium]
MKRRECGSKILTLLVIFCLVFSLNPLFGTGKKSVKQTEQNKLKSDKMFSIKEYKGDVFLLENERYQEQLLEKIKKAQKSVYIGAYLFKTSNRKDGVVNQLISELVNAQKRGVDVKVLLEKSDYNDKLNKYNTQTKNRLKKEKIKVRFDSPLKQTHSKLIIIDEIW